MRYVSTRGEAPPVGFLDAVLAGLAPDGGLYVPETWPQLTADEIAAFAGRPYAEVAADILGALRRRRDRRAPTCAEMCARRLRQLHPRRRRAAEPAGRRAAGCSSCSTARRLAFKDVAMQLLARLYDHALAAQGADA